ncbi:MAG: DNA methyltransferase, partial [Hyphomicrobiaceae bacterium]
HTTRQTKAHQKQLFGSGNEFATPKPEDLIERLLRLATNEEDLVLDSFAGSGTTGAVAHKLRRRWIMVESGDHCHTHIIPRLKKVIDGQDSGGITDAVGWKGGGGFRCYRLAPSLIEISEYGFEIISRKYNPAMLSEAMCKHMGYTYAPSPNPEEFWKHGYSSERDFIYVTSASIPRDAIEMLADLVGKGRSLLVCCKAFRLETSILRTLTLKKIPNCILENCEWGRDDYSLKIAALPEVDDGNDPDDGNDDGGDEPQSPPGSRRQGTDTGLELRRGAAATRSAKANGKGTARKAGSAKAKPPAAAPSKRAKAKPKAGTPVAAKTRTPAKAAKGKNTAIARSRHRYDDERQGRLL